MKPLTALLTLSLCVGSLSLLAQESSFYVGASAGLNRSEFQFTEDLLELYPTSEKIIGPDIGVDAGFQLGSWSVNTGVHYLQRGGRYLTENYEDNGRTAFFTANERHHIVQVPLTLGYSDRFGSAAKVGYTVEGGPLFAFGLKGNLDETTEYFGENTTDFQNYKVNFGNGVNDDYRQMMPGFRLEPSLWLDLNSKSRLTLGVAWDFGTKDAYNPRFKQANDFFSSYEGDVTNRGMTVQLGYQHHFRFSDKY